MFRGKRAREEDTPVIQGTSYASSPNQYGSDSRRGPYMPPQVGSYLNNAQQQRNPYANPQNESLPSYWPGNGAGLGGSSGSESYQGMNMGHRFYREESHIQGNPQGWKESLIQGSNAYSDFQGGTRGPNIDIQRVEDGYGTNPFRYFPPAQGRMENCTTDVQNRVTGYAPGIQALEKGSTTEMQGRYREGFPSDQQRCDYWNQQSATKFYTDLNTPSARPSLLGMPSQRGSSSSYMDTKRGRGSSVSSQRGRGSSISSQRGRGFHMDRQRGTAPSTMDPPKAWDSYDTPQMGSYPSSDYVRDGWMSEPASRQEGMGEHQVAINAMNQVLKHQPGGQISEGYGELQSGGYPDIDQVRNTFAKHMPNVADEEGEIVQSSYTYSSHITGNNITLQPSLQETGNQGLRVGQQPSGKKQKTPKQQKGKKKEKLPKNERLKLKRQRYKMRKFIASIENESGTGAVSLGFSSEGEDPPTTKKAKLMDSNSFGSKSNQIMKANAGVVDSKLLQVWSMYPPGKRIFTEEDIQGMAIPDGIPRMALHCDLCKPFKYGSAQQSVKDYWSHKNTLKHVKLEKAYLMKVKTTHLYLHLSARVAYLQESKLGIPSKDMCALCDVPNNTHDNNHLNIKECWILHQYANPMCCSHGVFANRGEFEKHCFTIEHLIEDYNFREKYQRDLNAENETLKMLKRSYNGTKPMFLMYMKFNCEVMEIFNEIFKEFGGVPVPNELDWLMAAHRSRSKITMPPRTYDNPNKFSYTYYDPSVSVGKKNILFETEFECPLCDVLLGRSQQSVIDHCSTQQHYNSLVRKRGGPRALELELIEAVENKKRELAGEALGEQSESNEKEGEVKDDDGENVDITELLMEADNALQVYNEQVYELDEEIEESSNEDNTATVITL